MDAWDAWVGRERDRETERQSTVRKYGGTEGTYCWETGSTKNAGLEEG
jgi:hypothetical protein